jgi:glycosyltransferase involved in cell wall biosynthesis
VPAEPDVTVVIATRDRREGLRRCLEALARQQTARRFDVVVVDDGSEPAIADADISAVASTRRLRATGEGPARARNLGLAAATAPIVAFTDDDTIPDPGWLEAACGFLDAHSGCVGVEGPIVSLPYDPLYELSLESAGPGAFYTANVAYRRAILETIGGFDDGFPFPHGEDLDLAYRAERIGPIGFEPGMVMRHVPRPMAVGDMVRRGRYAASEVELLRRHPERYGRAAGYPAAVFAAANAGTHWIRRVRAEGRALRRPRRALRLAAMAIGHTAMSAAAAARAARTAARRPLKVLFVMPHAHRHGGAENILWTYLRNVDRQRVEPALVFFDDGPFREEVAALGMSTHVLRPEDCPRPRIALFPPRLARIVRREQPDLVFSWLVEAQAFGSLAAVLTGRARKVIWWQANMPQAGIGERIATALPTRAVFLYSHATAAVQRQIRPRRRTLVVHPGIDAPAPLPEATRERLRRDLGLPGDRPVIGIVGRLMTWKGQHHVLRALALLRDRGHAVHGLIVGGNAYDFEPEYEPALRRLVDELGLADSVTFTGQVPDAAAYMQLMDIAVNASDHEPFGIVVLEAMAQEVPVVAVAAGGPAEIVEDGVSGLLTTHAGPEPFADAFERLIVSPELRRRLADGGRQRFEERFTTARMVEELTAALEQLSGREAVAA